MARPSPEQACVRCFLVEDSAIIRQNLIGTLEEMVGLDIVGYADTESGALAWMREHHDAWDLAIIDIFLKSGTGIEVLRRARTMRATARLVVLTNYATPDMRARCLAIGADRVFDKSAELEEMLAYCGELAAGVPD